MHMRRKIDRYHWLSAVRNLDERSRAQLRLFRFQVTSLALFGAPTLLLDQDRPFLATRLTPHRVPRLSCRWCNPERRHRNDLLATTPMTEP